MLSERRRAPAADVTFAALIALGATLLLVQMRGLSFFQDEWDFVLLRRGFSAHVLLTPHNEHLSLVPILVYKAMLGAFGATSYAPFKALAVLDLVLLAVVVGSVCQTLWGRRWGLVPVVLIVTLGAGGWTWLWPFQVGETLATAAGIVALAAAGRGDKRGDILACMALVVSLATASQGIGALVGVSVMIALGRNRRTTSRMSSASHRSPTTRSSCRPETSRQACTRRRSGSMGTRLCSPNSSS